MTCLTSAHGGAWLLAGAVAASVVTCARPLDWLVDGLVPGDALYYPEVALNVAQGRGFTFDRLTRSKRGAPS